MTRTRTRYMWRYAAWGAALGAAFVFGFAFHSLQFFPYHQLRGMARQIMGQSGEAEHAAGESAAEPLTPPADPERGGVLNRQYVVDRERLSLNRKLDSILLPLSLEGLRLSEQFEFPKGAGSITAVGNAVVVLDRLGNLYVCRSSRPAVQKLSFPPLPNHLQEYIASPVFAGLNDRLFRAHDIHFLPALNALAVSHSYFDTALEKTRLAVSTISIDPKSLQPAGEWKTEFLSDPEPFGSREGSGGDLAVRGADVLYVVLADQYIEGRERKPENTYGVIVEIDLGSGKNHVVSVGHRNASGLALQADGTLVSVEQGPYGGDEFNIIREGADYGWPVVSLGTNYGTYQWNWESPTGTHRGYAPPAFAWVPAVGVSAVLRVSRFDKLWNGDFLVSSLKGMSLYRLRMNDGFVQYSEPLFVGQRIRDITELDDGTIAMWTDDAQLLFLLVDREKLATGVRYEGYDRDVLVQQCLYCHHLGPTNASDFAPSLSGVFQRRIASEDFRYSAGLRAIEGVWTEDSLREFLSDPGKYAPGTSMPNRFLDDEQLDEIVQALMSMGAQDQASSARLQKGGQ